MAFVPLKRRAYVQYGLGQPPRLSDDGVAIIRATNIFRGRIVAKDLIRAHAEDLPLDRAPLLKSGEILVVRSGAYTGDSALVTPEWVGSAPGYDLRVTPGEELEPQFLAYTLLGRHAMDEIDLAKSRAAQPHLNAEDLGQVGILDTPISNQRAVADYLDRETARIDVLVAAKRRMVELLDARFAAALDHAFWESSIPQIALRQLATFVDYRGATPTKEDRGVPLVTASHVRDGIIDVTVAPQYIGQQTYVDWMRRGFPSRGDVIMTTEAPLGQVAQIDDTGVALAQRLILLKVFPPRILSDFLALALRSLHFQAQLEANATGSTALGIKADRLKALRVPVPALPRQAELVAHMRYLDQVRVRAGTALSRQIALLQEHRQALVTAAVTGQLDVLEAA